jgi:hypothetical protein
MEENAWDSDEKFLWRKDDQLMSPKIATMISLMPEQDPWKQDFVQELTPSPTPELKSVSLPYSAESSVHFYEKNVKEEISPVEAIKNDLLTSERRSLKGQEEEQIYSLHATADDEDLIRKVLTLQEKLKGISIEFWSEANGASFWFQTFADGFRDGFWNGFLSGINSELFHVQRHSLTCLNDI